MNLYPISFRSLHASLSPNELYGKANPLTPPGADESLAGHAGGGLDAVALNPQPLPPREAAAAEPAADPRASLRSIIIVGGHGWAHLAPPLPCPDPDAAIQP